jgi:hypothetical protein
VHFQRENLVPADQPRRAHGFVQLQKVSQARAFDRADPPGVANQCEISQQVATGAARVCGTRRRS